MISSDLFNLYALYKIEPCFSYSKRRLILAWHFLKLNVFPSRSRKGLDFDPDMFFTKGDAALQFHIAE